MLGKMSVGVRRIITGARTRISSASTMKVYGRLRATLTIHMAAKLLREPGPNRFWLPLCYMHAGPIGFADSSIRQAYVVKRPEFVPKRPIGKTDEAQV